MANAIPTRGEIPVDDSALIEAHGILPPDTPNEDLPKKITDLPTKVFRDDGTIVPGVYRTKAGDIRRIF